MSFGGWVSGVIFDATGSYAAAFANGFAWNMLNLAIVAGLLIRARTSSAGMKTGLASRVRAAE
jgi:hypothetical protein